MSGGRAPEGVDVTSVATGNCKFEGAATVGSKVVAAPYHSGKLLVYDTESRALEGVDITTIATGKWKFAGIAAVGSKVVAAPYYSDKLLVYDTESRALEGVDITTIATGKNKFTGIAAVGSKVVAAPQNSSKLLVYDTESKALEGVDVTSIATGNYKFAGITAVGTKVVACPENSDKLLIYDTVSKALEGVDVTSVAEGPKSFVGITAVGSKVVAAPKHIDKLLVYDTESRALEGVDISSIATGNYKFKGITTVGTKVVVSPWDSHKLLIYDTESKTLEGVDVSSVAPRGDRFAGITAVGSKVVAVPMNSDSLLVYDLGSEILGPAAGRAGTQDAPPRPLLQAREKELRDKVGPPERELATAASGESTALAETRELREKNTALERDLATAASGESKALAKTQELLAEIRELRERNAALERDLATAASGEGKASGNGLSAARSLGPSAQIQALTQVVEDLGAPPGTLSTASAFREWLASKGVAKETKFSARKILFGRPVEATQGIDGLTGVKKKEVFKRVLADDSEIMAMTKEIQTHGSEEDQANWKYIVDGRAQVDIPAHALRDIEKGYYHGGPLRKEDYDANHHGWTLQQFTDLPESKLAQLEQHHVAALRLYTTSTYRLLNTPLRARRQPHPLAVVVFFLDEALNKLKGVRAQLDEELFNSEITLWRGMAGVEFEKEFLDDLKDKSGTELAPMSTTADKDVAEKYGGDAGPSIIFKFKARAMQQGVCIQYLSVYPKEVEYLYPPGTLLTFAGGADCLERVGDKLYVTVVPQ